MENALLKQNPFVTFVRLFTWLWLCCDDFMLIHDELTDLYIADLYSLLIKCAFTKLQVYKFEHELKSVREIVLDFIRPLCLTKRSHHNIESMNLLGKDVSFIWYVLLYRSFMGISY